MITWLLCFLNSKLGSIKYKYFSSGSNYYFKPDEYLKIKYNELENNTTYIIDMDCGFKYLVLLQKTEIDYGSGIIYSYGLESLKYVRLNAGVWSTTADLVTNSDLGKFSANAINTSFKTYIANNLSGNGYLIFPFANMTDNPFTFDGGICVACFSNFLAASRYFLVGFNGSLVESKYIE